MNRIGCIIAVLALAGVLCVSGCKGPEDQMEIAKMQLVTISKDYLQVDHPNWAKQMGRRIIVIEGATCWDVQFPLPVDEDGQTAVVRIAKGTMEPLGVFPE